EIRAGESRRMTMEGRKPVLKKSHWLLLKREENLKIEQRFRLRDLLRYNLRTLRAYLLKEAFQQLWDYNSTDSAPSAASNSCSITHMANCPSPNQPTIHLLERSGLISHLPRPKLASR